MWQHFGHLQWQTCLIASVPLRRRRKDHGKSLEVVRSLRLAPCLTRMMKVLQQVNSSELLIANLTVTKVIWLYVLAFTNIFLIIISMRFIKAIHKMNHLAIAMFVCVSGRLSVCLAVCLGWVCIVIIRCTSVRIEVHSWIVQCSGHPDAKVCPPAPSHLSPVPPGTEVGIDVQTRPTRKH